MRLNLTAALITGICLLASCNIDNKTSENKPAVAKNTTVKDDQLADGRFVREMAAISKASIQLGKMVETHAMQPEIKNIGTLVVNDHAFAEDDLDDLAGESDITVPAKLNMTQQNEYNELAAKKGYEFDEACLNIMEKMQQSTIDKIENEMNYGNNLLLKKWAGEVLYKFRYHLEMTQQAKDATKNKMAGL